MKNDIETLEHVKLMVDTFYDKVRRDPLLSDIFDSRIGDHWPEHLGKMYRFWQTVLLDEHTYYGSPFVPHAKLPVSGGHFDQWVKLFSESVDDLFEGEKATKAKWQGQRMAEMFHSKITFFRDNQQTPLL